MPGGTSPAIVTVNAPGTGLGVGSKSVGSGHLRRGDQARMAEDELFQVVDVGAGDGHLDRRPLLAAGRKEAGELRRGKLGQRRRAQATTTAQADRRNEPSFMTGRSWEERGVIRRESVGNGLCAVPRGLLAIRQARRAFPTGWLSGGRDQFSLIGGSANPMPDQTGPVCRAMASIRNVERAFRDLLGPG